MNRSKVIIVKAWIEVYWIWAALGEQNFFVIRLMSGLRLNNEIPGDGIYHKIFLSKKGGHLCRTVRGQIVCRQGDFIHNYFRVRERERSWWSTQPAGRKCQQKSHENLIDCPRPSLFCKKEKLSSTSTTFVEPLPSCCPRRPQIILFVIRVENLPEQPVVAC